MTKKQILIGTSGHVDHGKTTLLHCLTGIDADRWVEEKERGITIDIGFAHLDDENVSLSFIDVPGHKDFVTNMLSGIFSIDLAILIVAADESVMPQTKEHLSILSYLGIEKVIPVITKIDLADEEMVELTELELSELFEKYKLKEPEQFFKVSSVTKQGVDEFKNYLINLSNEIIHDNSRPFYLPVDRSFSIKGHGTVVTGTLMSDKISIDDKVYIHPSEKTSLVKNINTHQFKVNSANCKKRVALNIPSIKQNEVERGQIITKKQYNLTTNFADAIIEISSQLEEFKDLKRVRLSIGTDDVIARVKLIEEKEKKPPFKAFCQLRFEHPVPCFNKQKFIVRSYSPVYTIGGGEILDNHPKKRKGYKKADNYLDMLSSKTLKDRIKGILISKKQLTLEKIEDNLFIKKELIEDEIKPLIDENTIVKIENVYFLKEEFEIKLKELISKIENYQKENPMKQGMAISLIEENFNIFLNYLIKENKLIKTGSTVKTPEFKQTLSAKDKENYNFLIKSIEEGKFSPPLISSLTKEMPNNLNDYLSIAVFENKIKRISSDLYFSSSTFKKFIEEFKKFANNKDSFEVKDFKEKFNVSRKYLIPMLEFLDGEQLISRKNDLRIIIHENLKIYGD